MSERARFTIKGRVNDGEFNWPTIHYTDLADAIRAGVSMLIQFQDQIRQSGGEVVNRDLWVIDKAKNLKLHWDSGSIDFLETDPVDFEIK